MRSFGSRSREVPTHPGAHRFNSNSSKTAAITSKEEEPIALQDHAILKLLSSAVVTNLANELATSPIPVVEVDVEVDVEEEEEAATEPASSAPIALEITPPSPLEAVIMHTTDKPEPPPSPEEIPPVPQEPAFETVEQCTVTGRKKKVVRKKML